MSLARGALGALLLLGLVAAVLGPSAQDAAAQRGARVGQAAPEITGGPWVNSEPLSIEKLRGRVVFVEFWTYG